MADLWVPPNAKVAGRPRATTAPDQAVHRALTLGREGTIEDPAVAEMKHNRRVNAKTAGAAQVSFATGRPRDPMFYWRQNNLPFDVSKNEELVKARDYCRTLYQTHPVIASAVDIFSKYPLTGMEFFFND